MNKLLAGIGICYQVLQALFVLGILTYSYINISFELILLIFIGLFILAMNIGSIVFIYKGLKKDDI